MRKVWRLTRRVEVAGTIDPDPIKQYIYFPFYIDAVASVLYDPDTDGAGITRYDYLHDANFNVVAIVTGTTSFNVVERYHYSPYGEVTILNGPSDLVDGTGDWTLDADQVSDIGNEFLYTGRRLDPETGLQYSRNRFYHLQLGRFVTRDPSEYDPGTYNLYEYVDSMPLIALDPTGLSPEYGSWWDRIHDTIILPVTGGYPNTRVPSPTKCAEGCKEVSAPAKRDQITSVPNERGIYYDFVYTWVAAGNRVAGNPGEDQTYTVTSSVDNSVSYSIEVGVEVRKNCTVTGGRTITTGESRGIAASPPPYSPSGPDCYLYGQPLKLRVDRLMRWPCWFDGKSQTCGKIVDTFYADTGNLVCECCPE